MKSRAAGTTLLQLSIVMTGILILVGLSIPTISFYKRYLVAAQAETIKTLLLCLQQKALLTGKEIQLHCNQARKTLITDCYHEHLSQSVFFGYPPDVMGPPSKPQQLLHNPITFADDTILFYPDGTISSGTLYLTDENKKFLYAVTCPSGQVGFVRIYRYDAQWNEIA